MNRPERPAPSSPAPVAARSNRRRWLWWSLPAVVLFLLIAVIWTRRQGAAPPPRAGGGRFAAAGNAPQSVRVATVTQGDMPVQLNALGTVTPLANVTVRTQ